MCLSVQPVLGLGTSKSKQQPLDLQEAAQKLNLSLVPNSCALRPFDVLSMKALNSKGVFCISMYFLRMGSPAPWLIMDAMHL